MEITGKINCVSQQQPGQFKKPQEGMGPFAHVNNQELNNIEDGKSTREKTVDSTVPKLLDFDAGMPRHAIYC